jgi:TRAP-type mannitol/chloroaromatic compound transport system substrate-binding protein
MLQSFHQPAEQFEIIFNKKKYDTLPEELRSILAYAVQAASADMSWKAIDRYASDYVDLQKNHGVKFYKTPDAILRRQLEIWDGVVAKRSAENPWFKKAYDSQRAFAERCARWQNDTNVDYKMAFNHTFAKKAAKKG